MDINISRRRFFASGIAIPGLVLSSPPEAWPRTDSQPEQAQVNLVDELMTRLGMTRSNAEAMVMRATRFVERPGAILLGNAEGAAVEVIEWERHVRKWQLLGELGCDVSLASAVAVASRGAATLIAGHGASMRWISSCHFGGAVGHVLRHARGHMFLITGGDSQSPPRRVEIG